MNKKIKEEVLFLLQEDKDIIRAVKNITNANTKKETDKGREKELVQEIHRLESIKADLDEKISTLEDKCRRYEEKEEELNDIIAEKEDKIIAIQKDLESCQKESKASQNEKKIAEVKYEQLLRKYEQLFEKYASLEEVYARYLDLGDLVISGLERILNPTTEASGSPEIFMAYGIQEGNIVALWEAIAANIELYSNQQKLEDLLAIFKYFLNLYEKISYKKVVINWPEINDIYDERFHTRTSASSATGRIEQVLLPGFSIGKNINKKSLVIVR